MDALPYFCLRFPQFFHRCSASLSPTIKLRLNLVRAAGPAYAGQRHVPSFTAAGWETTVDTLCPTHIYALMTVPILDSSGVYARKILYIFDWRNANVFLEHAHTITCFLTPTLQAWLQPHDVSTKQRRYLLLYDNRESSFFLSFGEERTTFGVYKTSDDDSV